MLEATGHYSPPFEPGDAIRIFQDGTEIPLPTTAGKHQIDYNDWRGEADVFEHNGTLYLNWFYVWKPLLQND